MYPEQLRELRAQYPNTQFDGRGRVIGGTPLDQYNTQQANPAAIPASVRTYSQYDPATNTWVRHTNGNAAPAQSPVPTPAQAQAASQGVPVNFNEWLGYTPAGFKGATWEMGGGNAQPRQVMMPLPRQTARQNAQPSDIGLGVTVTHVNNSNPYAKHANENPVMPLTQPRGAARTLGQYLKRNFTPATTGTVLVQQPQQESNAVSLREDMLSPVTRMRLENANISSNLGRALASAGKSLGNGFLNLFWNPSNYTDHSDPRW